ncbi:MAG TPA: hypothetical protein DEQ28_04600 [Clostridiales bacterium]|nr:hypothetical protein [Clostridiales bacterium]
MLAGERGAALIVALLVAVVGTVGLGTAGALAQGTARSANRWREAGSALYVAESGANEALFRLKFDPAGLPLRTYPGDPPSFTAGPERVGAGASYDVWVWPDGANPLDRQVVAIGRRGGARHHLQIVASPLQANPFAGTGSGHPVVLAPAGMQPTGVLELRGNQTHYLGNADGTLAVYCFTAIIGRSQARLVLRGPVHIYVVGDPGLDPDIDIAGGARLNIVADGSGWVPGDPRNLVIWVPGNISIHIDLTGNTEFYGGIYAPQSHLEMSGTADLVGGVVVATSSISGGANFVADPSMADIGWPVNAQLDYRTGDYR